MNKHDTAINFYELGQKFLAIKELSAKGEIDRICFEGFVQARECCDAQQPGIIDEMRKKTDPMM